MANIPILQSNFKTLTQVFPVPQLNNVGNPARDVNENLLPQSMTRQASLYIDANIICGVSKYFDPIQQKIRGGYSQIVVVGLAVPAFPIIVTESVATIKSYMDERNNCLELCTDL